MLKHNSKEAASLLATSLKQSSKDYSHKAQFEGFDIPSHTAKALVAVGLTEKGRGYSSDDEDHKME
eukprot:1017590-Pelagomonas_calceolata.AAC.2